MEKMATNFGFDSTKTNKTDLNAQTRQSARVTPMTRSNEKTQRLKNENKLILEKYKGNSYRTNYFDHSCIITLYWQCKNKNHRKKYRKKR